MSVLAKKLQAPSAAAPINADPNFNQVALLLHGDGTNGAQNNTFLDSSTNNFTITRNGNTTQGTFSPYGNLWSNYFDGNGDYLTVPNNTAIHVLGSDFCLEGWFCLTAAQGNYGLYSTYTANSGYIVRLDATYIRFYCESSPTDIIVDRNYTFTQGQWYHFSVTNSGGTGRIFVNGVQQGATFGFGSPTNSTETLQIGQTHTLTNAFPGYLSNFRVVKGSSVYTSNFTPSTAPLTAITNTSLLTCQSNRFKDNSSNNFTITRNGDTKVTTFSPFAPSAAYSASTNGGSGYFDGTGDYLNLGGQTAFAFGTGDFTIETWIYCTSLASAATIIGFRPSGTNGAYPTIYVNTNGSIAYYVSSVDRITGSAGNVKVGEWTHIAIARSGTSTKLFINGLQIGSTYSDSNNYSVGASRPVFAVNDFATANYFPGYFSNIRIVKGTAVYTANFTPPTAPLTAVANTQLLLNCTNAGIIDNAGKNDIETVGNAQVSTSVKKYGTGSMYFDGTGDWLSLPANNNFYFGTGDFTVEFWLNTSVGNQTIVDQWLTGLGSYTTGQWQIGMDPTTRYLNFYVATGTSAFSNFSTSSAPTSGQWVHVAFVRSSNVIKCYIDGTANANTLSFSGVVGVANSKASIGVQTNNLTLPFTGYIDDLRITKGYARYTANFTPPTQAFPDQ